MTKQNFFQRMFGRKKPLIHVIRLSGVIGGGSRLNPSLTAKDVIPLIEKAFVKGVTAVALQVNSPGGSPVQSSLIERRIRQLSVEKNIPVFAFVEDVAASGGYWLACAADEIYADETSILGSIGVVSAGFGFTKAIEKLGIDRRVHTAGTNKSILDPFQPEKPEDVEKLLSLQQDIHSAFKNLVRKARGSRLMGDEPQLFSGEFWAGVKAHKLGLIDGLGHMSDILQQKFGASLRVKNIAPASGFGLKRLAFGTISNLPLAAISAMDEQSLWAHYGLKP